MATTQHLQKKQDYYSSIEQAKKEFRTQEQSNPRYRSFTQTHFTAGDEQQFEEFRDKTNGNISAPVVEVPDSNRFKDAKEQPQIKWEKYHNIPSVAVNNTFRYLFHKFKKAIFIKIQDNQLKVFLPFSKNAYLNEWGDKYLADPKYLSKDKSAMENFLNEIASNESRRNPRFNYDTSSWVGNNCLVRYEYPTDEGDNTVGIIRDIFTTLCEKRDIPDIEFFINRRDFPILTLNGTEPYQDIYGNDEPLRSHLYRSYSPILSMCSRNDFADVLMPTWEDWTRNSTGKFFSNVYREYQQEFKVRWDQKKPTAVFRGSTTGCGVTVDTNMRLKISKMSLDSPIENGERLLDAGITKWNLRPRKVKNEKYLQTISPKDINLSLVKELSPEKQSEYRYIVNIDGHVSAYRLSLELNMGSVVLLVKSKYLIWYSDFLIEYVHYVPVKEDLSDLYSQIRWCRNNDSKCQEIADNARKFYHRFLRIDGVLDYLQKTLIDVKKQIGIYLYNYLNYDDLLKIDLQDDLKKMKSPIPTIPKIVNKISGNGYPSLKALEWMISSGKYYSQFVQEKMIKTSKNKEIVGYRINNFPLVIKKTKTDTLHEFFIGKMVVNSFRAYLPNFVYTFHRANNDLIVEQISGVTFEKWLMENFTMSGYLQILYQISMILAFAQNLSGFVHGDLYPWNIIIQQLPMAITMRYPLGDGMVELTTDLIPILIDFERSSIVYNGKWISPNFRKFSSIQDLLSILLSSGSIALDNDMSKEDIFRFLKTMNFISGRYTKSIKFDKISDFKKFAKSAKKYDEITTSDKYDLENLTPIDFLAHIDDITRFNNRWKCCRESVSPAIDFNQGNARQIFNFLDGMNLEESFLGVFHRVNSCSLPRSKNPYYLRYIYLTITKNIKSNYLQMTKVFGEKHLQRLKDTINLLDKIYLPLPELEGEFEESSVSSNLISSESFDNLEEITKILDSKDDYRYLQPIISIELEKNNLDRNWLNLVISKTFLEYLHKICVDNIYNLEKLSQSEIRDDYIAKFKEINLKIDFKLM